LSSGRDAVFGLDIPLMRLVNVFKSAAMGYGAEKRVILLHGPVGSSKSTIARLLKRGIEHYSRTAAGALYTFEWHVPEDLHHITGGDDVFPSPMNEEPLRSSPRSGAKAFSPLASATMSPCAAQGRARPRQPLIFAS
jgi:serine protein kinase